MKSLLGPEITRSRAIHQWDALVASLKRNFERHLVSIRNKNHLAQLAAQLRGQGFQAQCVHPEMSPKEQGSYFEDFQDGLIQALFVAEFNESIPRAPIVFIFDAHRVLPRDVIQRVEEDAVIRFASLARKEVVICADELTPALLSVFPELRQAKAAPK